MKKIIKFLNDPNNFTPLRAILMALLWPLLGAVIVYAWVSFKEPACAEQHPTKHYCVRWEK